MRRFVFLLTLLLFLSSIFFSQVADVSKLAEAKIKLENLQKELWKIDLDEYKEVEPLRKQDLVKGEFETTKQFEEREKKLQDKISEIENHIRLKTGPRREAIQKQINEILGTEFTGNIKITLSKYDADSEQFTVSSADNIPFNYFKIPLAEAKPLKDNFDECKFTGAVGVLLDQKNTAREYLFWLKIDFRGKTYQIAPQTFTAVKAMQMVFGNYDAATKTSRWETYNLESDNIDDPASGVVRPVPSSITSDVILFKPFRENGVEKFLLVTNRKATNEDQEMEWTCHACYGIPGAATFIKTQNYWKVETAQKHAGEIGSYGIPGEPSLVKIGPEKYALKFS